MIYAAFDESLSKVFRFAMAKPIKMHRHCLSLSVPHCTAYHAFELADESWGEFIRM